MPPTSWQMRSAPTPRSCPGTVLAEMMPRDHSGMSSMRASDCQTASAGASMHTVDASVNTLLILRAISVDLLGCGHRLREASTARGRLDQVPYALHAQPAPA